jgi:hypothetical protein
MAIVLERSEKGNANIETISEALWCLSNIASDNED